MTLWRAEHGRAGASANTLSILEGTERRLLRFGEPRPVVASIRIGAGLQDAHDFEVEIELAPGVVVAVRYQSVDEDGRDPDDLGDGWGAVELLVEDAVAALLRLEGGTSALADRIHGLRVHARRTLAEWGGGGVGATLVDIRLVCTEHCMPDRDLVVEARFTALDDHLRPMTTVREVDHPDQFMAELPTWRRNLEAPFAMRASLARQGADGCVDQLVLNAIAQYPDADAAWREIASGTVYWGCERLTVYATGGHVRCHGRLSDGGFGWNRSSVRLHGTRLPETVIAELRGRPIRSVLEHPVLSDDMIISDVRQVADHSGSSVYLEFDQPLLLFCSASGRLWKPDRAASDQLRGLIRAGDAAY